MIYTCVHHNDHKNLRSILEFSIFLFLEHFDEVIKSQIAIYILSSSVHKNERDQAGQSKYIRGFISKPLKSEMILSIVNEIEKAP